MNKEFNNNDLNNSFSERILNYKELFDIFNVPLAIFSLSGKLLKSNKFFCNLLGYDENEIHNMDFIEFTNSGDHKENITLFNQLVSREVNKIEFEKRYIKKNGEVVWANVTSVLLDDAFTNAKFIASIVKDITNDKKAELKLKESEQRYKYLAENIADVVWILDVNTMKIKYVSPSVFKLRGYTQEEVMQQTFDQVVEPESIKLIQELLPQRIKSYLAGNPDIPQTTVVLQPCKDGSKILTEVTTSLVGNLESGLQILGVSRDVTERKKTEENLLNSEIKMRAIIEGTPYLFFYTQDTNGDMTYVSPTVEQITGYTIEKWLHTRDWFITESKINQIAKERTYAHLRGEITHGSILVEIRHADGHILTLEIFENPVYSEGKVIGLQGVAHDITVRKKTEFALMESEKRYRKVVEEATEIIFTTDEKGNFTYVNPAALKSTGYTNDNLVNKNYLDLMLPDYKRRISFTYARQIKEKLENTYTEYPFYAKDGSIHWFGQNARLIIENGIFKGFFVIARDITERIAAEEQITLLSRAVEKSPASVVITDELGNIEYVNPKFVALTGYTLEEIKGKNPRILNSGEKPKEEYKTLWETIKSGKEWRGEFHNKKKNGELYWESATIVKIKNGKTFYLAVKEDITERKRSEENILLLAHAIESVSECVSITDRNDKILFINKAFKETYGYSEEELIGNNISMVRSQNDGSEMTLEILPKTKGGGWQGEIINRKKDGTEFPVYLSTAVVKDEKGEAIALIGVASDITERISAREELINAKEKAELSDKLKTEFLAQMSHEIRTPLNAILNYSDIIREEIGNNVNDDIKDSFDGMNVAGKRIIRTVESILDMSQLQTGQYEQNPERFDLHSKVLESSHIEFQSLAKEKNISFVLTKKTDDAFVYADEYSVIQIFSNLVDNAIKFTQEGFVKINVGRNLSGKLVVEVKDSGIGISKEYLPKLFTQFSQEEHGYTRKFEGNGLGLALVKKYCDLNKIEITVQSEKGKGTTFTLTFPN